jgi:dipeptidyl aminopeptidase/acylaminoacyl peptidase
MNASPTPRRRLPLVLIIVAAFLLFLALCAGPALGEHQALRNPSPAVPSDTLRWTSALSMRYHAIQGTALSPDGSLVAYVVREPLMEGEKSEYRSQIWVVPSDGGEPRQYTRGEHSASSPAFSPDGRLLAFTSGRSGKGQVWVMPVDGGEAAQATDAENGVGSFAWAPDGRSLAYTKTDPETEEEKEAKKEKRDVIIEDTAFKYAHLYHVPFDFGASEIPEKERLTEGQFHVTSFHWSPDGARIVFGHAPDPRLNTNFMAGDVSVVEVATKSVTPLAAGNGVERTPRVSPDGRWVAFVSTGNQPEPVGLGDVYVAPLSGGTPRKLADTHDRSANILRWSGDGASIFVSEAVGTTTQVLAVPVDGSPVRPVTEGDGVFGSVSFDADASRMAFTFQDSHTPWDVYVAPVEGFAMRKLTDLHADVPRPPLGRTELLRWPSQDGRFEIEGLLTFPVGYREGQGVPLVLDVHGGPAGVFSQSFTGAPGIYMLQTFAQEGYAVLRPNPRGSTGYGKEFRYANVRDWGFGDMDDLMAGVDRVIEMGVAHPDSLLLMGWSYGGYMTSFAVTRTDRFKAASMGAGLPNLISMTTTTDIQDYLAAHMDSEFWEDYETYQRHSAIYRIANVTTPTQVIHGANDLRVPFTQGQEFYRALDRRGVPTEFVVLPRTAHGPSEPKLLMAVTEHILRWFEEHLHRSGGGRLTRSPAAR